MGTRLAGAGFVADFGPNDQLTVVIVRGWIHGLGLGLGLGLRLGLGLELGLKLLSAWLDSVLLASAQFKP